MTEVKGALQSVIFRVLHRLCPEADEQGSVPVDSISALRILYGAVMVYSLTRFALSGWVEELWVKPTFFFKDIPSIKFIIV